MNLGQLDRRISIEQATQQQDGYGQVVPQDWTVFANAWAKYTPLSGDEAQGDANRETQRSTVKFTIHYIAGVTATMRIVYQNAYWDITRIVELGRRRLLELHATQII